MRAGDTVYLARVVDGEVRRDTCRLIKDFENGASIVAVRGGEGRLPVKTTLLHATPTAALLALEEQLREKAAEAKKHAADITIKAERLLIQAERARRMAEEGR